MLREKELVQRRIYEFIREPPPLIPSYSRYVYEHTLCRPSRSRPRATRPTSVRNATSIGINGCITNARQRSKVT